MRLRPHPSSTSLQALGLWCKAHPEKVVGMTSGTFDLSQDGRRRQRWGEVVPEW